MVDQPLSTSCYIDILPDEILSEIQITATYSHHSDLDRYRFPSVLCQVSHHWRNVAYTTPRIWSFILICNQRTLGHTQDRVALAGSVLLEIKIDNPQGVLSREKVLQPLLPNSNRWASLDLLDTTIKDYAAYLPDSLPFLTNISFADHGAKFTLGTSLPRLTCMTLSRSWLCLDLSARFESLTEFHAMDNYDFHLPFERLLEFLRGSPNLEILELNDSWLLEAVTTNEAVQVLLSQAIEHRRLKAIRLDRFYVWELVIFLSCVHAPGLQNLMLSITEDDNNVPSLLHLDQLRFKFPSIQKLTIRRPGISDDGIERILAQMQEIRVLSLIEFDEDFPQPLALVLSYPSFTTMASRLERIYIHGSSIATLYGFLCEATLTDEAQSLLLRATWEAPLREIEGAEMELEDSTEGDSILSKLRAIIPHLGGAEEPRWWD